MSGTGRKVTTMSEVYEVVGAIERSVAETLGPSDGTILVDDGDGEFLIARPKEGDNGE